MTLQPGLHLIQSNRLEILAGRFAALLADRPLLAPLSPEAVVVHDRTVGEWLDLTLARTQGVAANMHYRSPGQFIWELYRAAGLTPRGRSVYDVEVLRWHIFRALGEPGFTGRFAPLRTFLQDGQPERRFDLAVRLAELYNRYLVYRMDWLQAWERGESRRLGDDEAWQAELWRRLVHELEEPHRAALFTAFLDAVPQGISGLPERLSVFGISSLSPAYVRILEALGRSIPVYVYLLNPSREKWDDIADLRYRAQVDLEYSAELMHIDVPHALLGSLGKQGRDFIRFAVDAEGEGSGVESHFEDPGSATLLHALQSGILHLSEQPVRVAPDDASISIHSCHSRMREVEVLRDRLLDLLDTDHTLRASDILVLAPDIDQYAPYCEAVFSRRPGGEDQRGGGPLPYDVAERSRGQVDPVVDLWLRLLDLPLSRFDADLVLDLLRLDPVRDAFGIDAGELATITGWVEGAGIRWGFDGAQKERWGLPPSERFTWAWGLDRMVLGVALPRSMTGDVLPLYGGLLPFDAIEGQQIALLDRFLTYIEALKEWVADLAQPRTLPEWEHVLGVWLDRFTGDARPLLESKELLRDHLADTVSAAADAGFTGTVDHAVLRLLYGTIDAGAQAASRFLGGGITFASMKPMRPLPYRVIAILGMGDGEFPRTLRPPAFDLMQAWYRHGDRSARLDDRYLFLELLLSARDHLLITYVGEDIRSGKPIAMSPVLAELLEFLGRIGFDSSATPGHDRIAAAVRALVVTHPLQAFSRRYFDGSDPRLFSYASDARTIAREAGRGTVIHHALFPAPLPAPGEEFRRVRLEDLCRFFGNPAGFLFGKRLGVRYREEDEGIETVEPLTMGHPETRAVYRALFEYLPKPGVDERTIFSLLEAGGALPVGVTAQFGFARVMTQAREFIEAYRALLNRPHLPGIATARIVGPWTLEIDHPGVTADGIFIVKPGKIHEKDIIAFWVRFLAASLVHPHAGRGGITGTCLGLTSQLTFAPVPDAADVLARLLDAYGAGLQRPLPFFPKTAIEFAKSTRVVKGKRKSEPADACAALRRSWDHPNTFAGFVESEDPYFARAFASGDEAITDEFADLAALIAGRILAGMEHTEFGRKKGR